MIPDRIYPNGKRPNAGAGKARGPYKNTKTHEGLASLDKCKCCGLTNTMCHAKYSDRCVDCGVRYAKYSSYKSMQKKSYTSAREALLSQIRIEYERLKADGYTVPRDV